MFAFFIYAIIFNSLNTRSEKFNLFEHIGENKNFVLVMGAIFVLQTIIIEIGGKVFNTTLLEPKALLVSIGTCSTYYTGGSYQKSNHEQVNNTYEIIIMGLSQVITVR